MPYSRKRYGTRKKYKKYQRCVKKVKKRGGVRSSHAICRAAIYGKKKFKPQKGVPITRKEWEEWGKPE